jgi:TRAP-type C4-dicarboxylate transport system substrate-binding protein
VKKSVGVVVCLAAMVASASCLGACSGSTSETSTPTSATPETTTPSSDVSGSTSLTEAGQALVLRFSETLNTEEEAMIQEHLDSFNERVGGRYVIEMHNAGELVPVNESLSAVQAGAVEMATYPLDMFANLDPRLGVPALPFLFNNIRASNASLADFMSLYSEVLEGKYNQKVLALWCNPPLDVISANQPIKTLDDWQGKLVQSISPVTAAIIESLGGTPVSIPYSDAYSSIQKGVVESTIQSGLFFLIPFALYEVTDYITLSDMLLGHGAMVINLDTWNGLPSDVQEALTDEFQAIGEAVCRGTIEADETIDEVLAEYGMEVYRLPEDERERWREALLPYYEETLGGLGAFGEEAVRIAEKVNAEFPYLLDD